MKPFALCDTWPHVIEFPIRCGRLKVGRLYGRRFATRREAMNELIDWLTFYKHKRLHSTLGYVSPMTLEQRWAAA